jgi:hypothetical protein
LRASLRPMLLRCSTVSLDADPSVLRLLLSGITRMSRRVTQELYTASLGTKLANMCVNASLIHGPWTMYYERFHGILSAEINRGISIEE